MATVASVFVVVLPIYVLDVKSENKQLRLNLQRHADLSLELFAQSTAQPLWDFNHTSLENLFLSLSKDEIIQTARLSDLDGNVVARYETDHAKLASPLDVSKSRVITLASDLKNEPLGTLHMTFSARETSDEFAAYMNRKVISFVTLMSLIALALLLVLGRIIAPFRTLIASISAIRNGDLESPVLGIERTDEIGAVANALNQLRLTEAEMVLLRQEQDAVSRRNHYRMERALESTTDGVILLDEHGSLAMQNPRAKAFFGALPKGADCNLAHLIDVRKDNWDGVHIDDVIHLENQDTDYDLRVRIDPIRDQDGTALGQVFLASDITEQLGQKRRADHLTVHDGLTGLGNRRALENELSRAGDEELCLLLGGLDRFKNTNEALGHAVGDALLVHVARILEDIVGEKAIPLRLGSDEFAVIGRGLNSHAQLAAIGEALIAELALPQSIDGRNIQTGMSVGIATYPVDTQDVDELMQFADLALCDAKSSGRGQIRLFQPSLQLGAQRQQLLETELSKAMAAGHGPWPIFQKQTDAKTGKILGFEALARWSAPTLGNVSPAEFIPVAEECGQIRAITRRILNTSFALASDLGAAGFKGKVAVNLSPTLFNGDAYELVKDALEKTKCPANLAEVEITEQVHLTNSQTARQEVEAIRNLGVSVALDDFGMGYSSLSYLTRFPVDKIKIDRAFVTGIDKIVETRAIVCAIVQLGHALGMTVTGEGAETPEERSVLTVCEVNAIQGWIDGKPIVETAVRDLFDGLPELETKILNTQSETQFRTGT